MSSPSSAAPPPVSFAPEELRGRAPAWGTPALALVLAAVAVGLWLRLRGLAAEGFGDDEVHKWLAAQRYLHLDFSGDDVEHPMLMKDLVALAIRLFGGWLRPEALTRLPNALAGGLSVLVVGLLGKRMWGRWPGVLAAWLAAVSVTFVGYQRVAKEDTLLGLFLMLCLGALAEAKAAADDGDFARQRRWEWAGAASVAGMLASKYFFFLTPVPVVFTLWVRGTGTAWRVPASRWLQLVGGAALLWAAVNWSPFLPSTWEYARSYVTGGQTVHGSLFFRGRIFHNLVEYGVRGTPPDFYLWFTLAKLTPPVLVLAVAGLAVALVRRRPADRLVLSWLAVWFLVHSASGSKWGRFYTSVLPAFLLLAVSAVARGARWMRARGGEPAVPRAGLRVSVVAAAVAIVTVGTEAAATVAHAPHQRTYVSVLAGGDGAVDWYFPHCDYFDAGFREAVAWVAAHAEPGAELSTEIDWPAKLYAEEAGRADLKQTLVRRGRTCRAGVPCYVVTQVGRLYFLNQDAVAHLATRTPVHVESIRGRPVVRVYRLAPGESPFPDEDAGLAAGRSVR